VVESRFSWDGSRVDQTRELVRRAAHNDHAAFAALVRLYERTALAIAYAIVQDASTAGDVTQDAFLRAWERLGELDDPARFGAWLARIVRNLAADAIRRRPREMSGSREDGFADARHVIDPSHELDRSDQRSQINAAIASLDELTRSAVVLRYYENLSSKQIAELLELSPGAVDMRLSRARAELREKLATLRETPAL
jgi:RNA polymerase sigma factor (sigma-70 family)